MDIERLCATGFLRTAPDGTGDIGDQNVARNDVVAETIKIVSTSLMGVTVGCAQCHSHRYDPISHHDYYRIRAIFEPALDWKDWRDQKARLINLWSAEEKTAATQVETAIQEINGQRSEALKQIVNDIFEKVVATLTADEQSLARDAKAIAADKRTDAHKQILKDYPRLNVDSGSAILYEPKLIADHNKKFEDLLATAKSKRPADNFIACLTEVPGHKPVTYRFARGDIQQPRDDVVPGDLSILPTIHLPDDDPQIPTTGRRLAFARHLTSGSHPLVARTLVNRFWMYHFGRGIVPTPEKFRRGIYIQARRSMPLAMLEPFDLAAMSPNCDRRSSSTVAPQSLLMMNNEVILTLAERFARQVEREVGSDPTDQMKHAWWLAYSTAPTEVELAAGVALLSTERHHFQSVADAVVSTSPASDKQADKKPVGALPETQALSVLCQALFSSNRFLYVD